MLSVPGQATVPLSTSFLNGEMVGFVSPESAGVSLDHLSLQRQCQAEYTPHLPVS